MLTKSETIHPRSSIPFGWLEHTQSYEPEPETRQTLQMAGWLVFLPSFCWCVLIAALFYISNEYLFCFVFFFKKKTLMKRGLCLFFLYTNSQELLLHRPSVNVCCFDMHKATSCSLIKLYQGLHSLIWFQYLLCCWSDSYTQWNNFRRWRFSLNATISLDNQLLDWWPFYLHTD